MKALVVASGIVFWTLMLTVAVLLFLPAGDGGEPVATVAIKPAPPGAAPLARQPQAATRGVELPPGFSVTPPTGQPRPPMLAPPGQGTSMVPVTPGQLRVPPPGPGGSLQPGPDGQPATESHAAAETPSGPTADPAPASPQVAAATPVSAAGATSLATVPELVEQSQYGPLPKIAADGRRPAEAYARPSPSAQGPGGPARVAVLVSGLGVPGAPPDGDVIKGLPPPVSLAYGAYGRGLQERVSKARADGHEVLLAIPLEPNDYPAEDPGPHTLLTTLPTDENIMRLHWLMSRYTGYVGVTNHMGAKFEATQSALQPVFAELQRRGLIYLDKSNAGSTTAATVATGVGLDYSVAQVRLDAGNSTAELAKALAELEATAKAKGTAIGVVTAAPATVKQIAEWASSLKSKGLVLVPVSAAMRAQRQS
jgi:polysaccharide deacetylase 2 family uncharacterized protein YibQ